MISDHEWKALPGGELVRQGLIDLRQGNVTVGSLLVSIATSRLREVGLDVPERRWEDPEIRLYQLLGVEHGDGAHSHYNSLLRQLLSFLTAAACARR